MVFRVRICLGGGEYLGLLYTDDTIHIVAKKTLPRDGLKNTMPTTAICIGDGHMVHSCGNCEVEITMGSRSIPHRFDVMVTEAFVCILGADFFTEQPQVLSLTLQASYFPHVDHRIARESLLLEHTGQVSRFLGGCKKP